MAASSAVRFKVQFSCVSCIPVVVTTLQAFCGKLPDFFVSCCDCWRWYCSIDKGPRGLGILESGNRVKSIFIAPQCRLKRQPKICYTENFAYLIFAIFLTREIKITVKISRCTVYAGLYAF